MFPRKLSGTAAMTAAGWAASAGSPAEPTSSSRTASANRNAATLTVKNRAACRPRARSPVAKVQRRFHQKLLAMAIANPAPAAAW